MENKDDSQTNFTEPKKKVLSCYSHYGGPNYLIIDAQEQINEAILEQQDLELKRHNNTGLPRHTISGKLLPPCNFVDVHLLFVLFYFKEPIRQEFLEAIYIWEKGCPTGLPIVQLIEEALLVPDSTRDHMSNNGESRNNTSTTAQKTATQKTPKYEQKQNDTSKSSTKEERNEKSAKYERMEHKSKKHKALDDHQDEFEKRFTQFGSSFTKLKEEHDQLAQLYLTQKQQLHQREDKVLAREKQVEFQEKLVNMHEQERQHKELELQKQKLALQEKEELLTQLDFIVSKKQQELKERLEQLNLPSGFVPFTLENEYMRLKKQMQEYQDVLKKFLASISPKPPECEITYKLHIFSKATARLFNNKNEEITNLSAFPDHMHQTVKAFMNKCLAANRCKGKVSKCAEPFTIPQSDRRKSLQGTQGLRATTFIPKNTILGIYVGTLYEEMEFMESQTHVLHSAEYYEGYAFGIENEIGGSKTLLIDASRKGSILRYVNDRHIDPLQDYSENSAVAQENTKWTEIVYKGWPYILAYTIKDVHTGSEILADYGKPYWDGLKLILARQQGIKKLFNELINDLALLS